MEGHSTASEALEDVRNNLVGLIEEKNSMTVEIRGVIQKLDEIGTPEMMQEITSLEERVENIVPFFEDRWRKLGIYIGVSLTIQVILIVLGVLIIA